MVEKYYIATEEDLQVNLTLQGFFTSHPKKFTLKIIRPYCEDNMNKVMKILMEKVISEKLIASEALGAKGNG
jgi:hypothetical protein